jgi:hypothetical protein
LKIGKTTPTTETRRHGENQTFYHRGHEETQRKKTAQKLKGIYVKESDFLKAFRLYRPQIYQLTITDTLI